MKIKAKRIRSGSLLKILSLAIGIPFFLWFVLLGVLALAGVETVQLNGEQIYGFSGFFKSILYGFLGTTVMVAIWFVQGYIVLYIFSKFRWIELEFSDAEIIEFHGSHGGHIIEPVAGGDAAR
jgi:hypothetical protein